MAADFGQCPNLHVARAAGAGPLEAGSAWLGSEAEAGAHFEPNPAGKHTHNLNTSTLEPSRVE